MPEATLRAFADHGQVGALMRTHGGDAEPTLHTYASIGIDHQVLAAQL